MSFCVEEERGRFLLRTLLWLVFISAVAEQVLYLGSVDGESLAHIAVQLAPTAIILWALHRGNWPALVLLAIGTINSVSVVTEALVQGRGGNLTDPALLAAAFGMGMQMSVFFCVLRSGIVIRWLEFRRAMRTNRDLPLELVLFLLSVALMAATTLHMAGML